MIDTKQIRLSMNAATTDSHDAAAFHRVVPRLCDEIDLLTDRVNELTNVEWHPPTDPTVEELLETLRSRGWHVAVHNDYHTQLGGWCTSWLFTNGWLTVKGEAATDRQALRLAIGCADAVEKAASAAHDRGVHLPEFVNLKPTRGE